MKNHVSYSWNEFELEVFTLRLWAHSSTAKVDVSNHSAKILRFWWLLLTLKYWLLFGVIFFEFMFSQRIFISTPTICLFFLRNCNSTARRNSAIHFMTFQENEVRAATFTSANFHDMSIWLQKCLFCAKSDSEIFFKYFQTFLLKIDLWLGAISIKIPFVQGHPLHILCGFRVLPLGSVCDLTAPISVYNIYGQMYF